jgi:hypothetical protein
MVGHRLLGAHQLRHADQIDLVRLIRRRKTYLATRPAHVQNWMIRTPGTRAAYTALDSKYSAFGAASWYAD